MYDCPQRALHTSNVIAFPPTTRAEALAYGQLLQDRPPLPSNRRLRLAAEIFVTVAAAVACSFLILFTR